MMKQIVRKFCRLFYRALDDNVAVISLVEYERGRHSGIEQSRFSYRTLGEQELTMLAQVVSKGKFRKFTERLRESQGIVVVDADGTIAGYGWWTGQARNNEGGKPFYYAICPKPDSVYLYDFFIMPGKRGQGAGIVLVRSLLQDVAKVTIAEAFLTFSANNQAMRTILSKLGFRVVGKISYRRCLWHKVTDVADLEKVCQSNAGMVGSK